MSKHLTQRLDALSAELDAYEAVAKDLYLKDPSAAGFWGLGRVIDIGGRAVFAAAYNHVYPPNRSGIGVRFALLEDTEDTAMPDELTELLKTKPVLAGNTLGNGGVVIKPTTSQVIEISAYPTYIWWPPEERHLLPLADIAGCLGEPILRLAGAGDYYTSLPMRTVAEKQAAHAVRPERPATPEDFDGLTGFIADPANGPAFFRRNIVNRVARGQAVAQLEPLPELPAVAAAHPTSR